MPNQGHDGGKVTAISMFKFDDHSHQRYNPLNDTWILCSPHRAKRPWLGQEEAIAGNSLPEYDPKCYLCPGNSRVGGDVNPKYNGTFIFDNDFPAVKQEQPVYDSSISLKPEANDSIQQKMHKLFKVEGVRGCAKVICFSEKHNLTMAEMKVDEVERIVHQWIAENINLKARGTLKYVQIFENKGATMGCSNPHPHGQIWATDVVPQEPAKELASLQKYKAANSCCLLCDLVETELQVRDRIVCENEEWVCIVPFWAVWPFETLLLPKKHVSVLEQLRVEQQTLLADLLRKISCKYDNLFKTSFPYSMGIHGAPLDDESGVMHLHLHFYPPLLRSATVKKFLVGFEMLGEAQRDLTAEQAAARLRDLSEVHYTQQ